MRTHLMLAVALMSFPLTYTKNFSRHAGIQISAHALATTLSIDTWLPIPHDALGGECCPEQVQQFSPYASTATVWLDVFPSRAKKTSLTLLTRPALASPPRAPNLNVDVMDGTTSNTKATFFFASAHPPQDPPTTLTWGETGATHTFGQTLREAPFFSHGTDPRAKPEAVAEATFAVNGSTHHSWPGDGRRRTKTSRSQIHAGNFAVTTARHAAMTSGNFSWSI